MASNPHPHPENRQNLDQTLPCKSSRPITPPHILQPALQANTIFFHIQFRHTFSTKQPGNPGCQCHQVSLFQNVFRSQRSIGPVLRFEEHSRLDDFQTMPLPYRNIHAVLPMRRINTETGSLLA